jgi:effector-binding domain-containing protein
VKNLLPIGRFSKICRLTVKALRLYDELGLLRPAVVDEATGYRYYSLAQAAEAERIRLLRALEMPLDVIKQVVDLRDPAAVRALLDQHRQRIEERIAEHQRALDFLSKLSQKEAVMSDQVCVKQQAEQPVLGIRTHTPIATIGEVMGRCFGQMFGYLAEIGVRPAGPPLAIYHDPEFKEDDVDVEVCVPVERRVAGRGEMRGSVLSAGPVAATLHAGPYHEVGPAYCALVAWIQEHGHECAGPPREIYLVGPGQAADPAEYRTEILWPLEETSEQ